MGAGGREVVPCFKGYPSKWLVREVHIPAVGPGSQSPVSVGTGGYGSLGLRIPGPPSLNKFTGMQIFKFMGLRVPKFKSHQS